MNPLTDPDHILETWTMLCGMLTAEPTETVMFGRGLPPATRHPTEPEIVSK